MALGGFIDFSDEGATPFGFPYFVSCPNTCLAVVKAAVAVAMSSVATGMGRSSDGYFKADKDKRQT